MLRSQLFDSNDFNGGLTLFFVLQCSKCSLSILKCLLNWWYLKEILWCCNYGSKRLQKIGLVRDRRFNFKQSHWKPSQAIQWESKRIYSCWCKRRQYWSLQRSVKICCFYTECFSRNAWCYIVIATNLGVSFLDWNNILNLLFNCKAFKGRFTPVLASVDM